MSIEIVSLTITIVLALTGYLFTHWNGIKASKRKEQLDLVNSRISEFYGPLYIATQTGDRAYKTLLQKLGKKTAIFTDSTAPPTEKDIVEWRFWMQNVFKPVNEFIERLILEKAYLIQEQEMPKCLLDFITSVSVYKVQLKKWENSDFDDFPEYISKFDFPTSLDEYAADSYRDLKARQLRLIGKSK